MERGNPGRSGQGAHSLRIPARLWGLRATYNPQGSSFRVQPFLSKGIKYILSLKCFKSRAGDVAQKESTHPVCRKPWVPYPGIYELCFCVSLSPPLNFQQITLPENVWMPPDFDSLPFIRCCQCIWQRTKKHVSFRKPSELRKMLLQFAFNNLLKT